MVEMKMKKKKQKSKRMKPTFPFFLLSSSNSISSSSSSSSSSSFSSSFYVAWRWPPYYHCHQQPRTLSFRSTDDTPIGDSLHGPGPGPKPKPTKPDPHDHTPSPPPPAAAVETVIRGVKSDRLFFSPGETGPSILQRGGENDSVLGAVAVAVDSADPAEDFRKSMAEMVEACGLRDWEAMEKLLSCYLRINVQSNHGYIVAAFVDLLVGDGTAEEEGRASKSYYCSEINRCRNCSPPPASSTSTSPVSLYTSVASPSSSSEDSTSSSSSLLTPPCKKCAVYDSLEVAGGTGPLLTTMGEILASAAPF